VKKTIIHIFHDDDDSVTTGSRLAQRMLEEAPAAGVEVEVFCFGPAQRRLAAAETAADAAFNRQIDELIADDVRVGACVNLARTHGAEDLLRSRGLDLHVARDEFLRFTLEGATVITF